MSKQKVYVVPHSHWDREWYFSIEDSNVLLVENLSYLIDYLESHPEFPSYTFDGQLSVIEDYLKIRPEDLPRIKRLVQEKRLFIGPWFTQADTLLIQTESIIRNLLIGQNGAEKLGHSMNIGYLPDIFGQHRYLPSIFTRFQIEYSILQRGIYHDQLKEGLNFYWQSPNEEKIATNNLFFGYGPGKFLSSDPEYIGQTLLPILKTLSSFHPMDDLLLPAGGDQVLIRNYFPKVIQELNSMNLDYEFILSDYESYMSEVWQNKSERQPIIQGELIASQQSRIHHTIRSQRADIKHANSRIEEKIYQQLEPLALLVMELGGTYPQKWIEYCLKLLFDVHAHDSIGGCNSDETNQAILSRLAKIERIVDGLLNILKKQLSRGITKDNENAVVVFQLLPKKQTKQVKLTLFTKEPHFVIQDQKGNKLPQVLLNQVELSGGKQINVTAEGEKEVELPGYYRNEVLVEITFDGFGYQKLSVLPATQIEHVVSDTNTKISNEYYTLEVDNGEIILTRFDQQAKRNFLIFENTIDAGDSYDYSPLENGQQSFSQNWTIISSEVSSLQSSLTLETTIQTARDIDHADRFDQKQVIRTIFTLKANDPLIYIEHQTRNTSKDHRVRALFSLNQPCNFNYADQGYSLIERSNENRYLKNWKNEFFAEAPYPIYPLENFAGIDDKTGTTTVFTSGIKEYTIDENHLALTLYRSVGLLGRDNLVWRPGRASGINNKVIETPDAQLLGDFTCQYALFWGESQHSANQLFSLLERYRTYHLSYHVQNLNTFEERLERFELPQPVQLKNLPNHWTGICLPDNLFVTTMKKAELRQQPIIRIFNPNHSSVKLPSILADGKQLWLNEKTNKPETKNSIDAYDFQTIQIDTLQP